MYKVSRFTFLLFAVVFLNFSCEDVDLKESINADLKILTDVTNEITDEDALSGGRVVSNDRGDIVKRGVCWSVTSEPTINDSITTDSLGTKNGIGQFGSKLRNLKPNTNYYVRAYAINDKGVGYGNLVSFKTAKSLEISDYNGIYNGAVVVWQTVQSAFGSQTQTINDVVSNVNVRVLSNTQILIGVDTATVENKQLKFKPTVFNDTFFNSKITITKTGTLAFNKIIIWSEETSSTSFFGMSSKSESRTTLVKY
jgi:hypothetical protein